MQIRWALLIVVASAGTDRGDAALVRARLYREKVAATAHWV